MFANMKLKTSLLIVLGMFSIAIWSAVGTGWMSARASAQSIDAIVALSDSQLQPLHNTERSLLLALSRMDNAYIQLLHGDQVRSTAYARQASRAVKAARESFTAYLSAATADGGASPELMRAFDAYVKVLGAREEALYDVSKDDYAGAAQASEQADRDFESTLRTAIRRSEARREQWRAESDQRYAAARRLAVGLVLLSLVLTACYWRLFDRVLLGPLRSAGRHFDRIAAGDLTQTIDGVSNNEIGILLAALRDMQSSLKQTVGTIRRASDDVDAAARDIAQGNADLSLRTGAQAAALERTASTLEQLASAVRENAENTRDASALALEATGEALRGRELVEEVEASMSSLGEAGQRIADFVGQVDQIAFQTNLLALNAAVEAAHAGSHGAGFAVVAAEVRSLAMRSAAAARQIRDLVDRSSGNIERGAHLVSQAGLAMQSILGAAERVRDRMREIAAATAEQSAAIHDASSSVVEMESTTSRNVKLVDRTASAAAGLSSQAGCLVRSVALFQLAVPVSPGDSRPRPATAAPSNRFAALRDSA